MVLCAMFSALALAVEFLTVHVHVGFLTFDLKDAIITLFALIAGPFWALPSAIIVCLLEFAIEPATGPWGLLMNFAATFVFAFVASLIYSRRKTPLFAAVGLSTAVVAMTAIMIPMNLLITPLYAHTTTSAVAGMIPTLLLPFNLLKALANAGAVGLLYKPFLGALQKARLIEGARASSEIPREARLRGTVLAVCIGALVLILSMMLMMIFLDAEIDSPLNPHAAASLVRLICKQ
jgi:riboflavin transporter FmnP